MYVTNIDTNDLSELLYGAPEVIAKDIGVCVNTVRRWKTGKQVPKPMLKLLKMRYGDLTGLLGEDWKGFHFGTDGLFYHPFWRKGFTANEMQAMFYQIQTVWSLKREILSLKRRVDELESEIVQVNEQVWKYRRLVSLESRLGLMLERVAV